jgi:hypothetical protein
VRIYQSHSTVTAAVICTEVVTHYERSLFPGANRTFIASRHTVKLLGSDVFSGISSWVSMGFCAS